MTPRSFLLSTLVVMSLVSTAWCSPMCNNQCCRFVEGFPVRLKKLREDYSRIRDFYEANNDLDTALLDQSIEHSFESPFACQAMDSILDFYLSTVLPTAMAGVTEETRDLKPHVESIQQIFDELKTDVTKCVSSRQTSRSHRSAETQTRTDFTFVQVPLADMMPFSCKNRRDVVECISEDQNSPSIENDPVMTS
ncbi:interleukin-10 isoform X2 [Xiphias gladius]|uniref:interleukin-10 isoform X2 n=1 Tax=Xiphias gladius TaxID=8245 RepID=UPI001A9915C7|nr:interleukin-10 isoform X2 [Xiphias gladius]